MEYTPQETEPVVKALLKTNQYTNADAQLIATFCIELAPELLKIRARMLSQQKSNPISQEHPP